jgi:hypothetical protein
MCSFYYAVNVGNVELQTTLDEQHIYLVKKHYNA